MALILVRGENKTKLLSAEFADSLVEQILKSKLKTTSNVATAFFVKEDTTLSILKIKQIHPPAHIVVVSPEYNGYEELKEKLTIAHDMDGYKSFRALNAGKIDYSVKGKKRYIQNDKLNSYME